jgi:cytochrome P450
MSETTVAGPPPNRDPADPLDPAPEFARLRREEPVLRIPGGGPAGFWLLTRHADVRELLASPHTSTALGPGGVIGQPGFLVSMDPPDHTRLRRMLTREFTVRRVNAMRPRVAEIVDGFLDDMERTGPPADLMAAFALPVPSLVICELLGVPYADRADFQRRSGILLSSVGSAQADEANAREMNEYMVGLIAGHRRDPGEDILGMLIREHAGGVTDDELVGIGNIMLIAGHETTANTIGLGTLLLLRHPDQLALVRDDPTVLRSAIEEILRHLSIVQSGSPRLVTQDITIGGRPIPAGDMVMVALPSANRDTAFLADADRFDVTRPPGAHVAFGHGIHQCLGQQLARMEMAVALPALLRRFPGLRLDGPEEALRFRDRGPVNGVRALPLTW